MNIRSKMRWHVLLGIVVRRFLHVSFCVSFVPVQLGNYENDGYRKMFRPSFRPFLQRSTNGPPTAHVVETPFSPRWGPTMHSTQIQPWLQGQSYCTVVIFYVVLRTRTRRKPSYQLDSLRNLHYSVYSTSEDTHDSRSIPHTP